jgi:hypothetical protein
MKRKFIPVTLMLLVAGTVAASSTASDDDDEQPGAPPPEVAPDPALEAYVEQVAEHGADEPVVEADLPRSATTVKCSGTATA